LGAHGCRQAALYREPIGDEKLLARLDIRDRVDVYPSIGFDGLAIGDACVVEPARAVAAKRTVDDPPIG
jgi:hypothetical protein